MRTTLHDIACLNPVWHGDRHELACALRDRIDEFLARNRDECDFGMLVSVDVPYNIPRDRHGREQPLAFVRFQFPAVHREAIIQMDDHVILWNRVLRFELAKCPLRENQDTVTWHAFRDDPRNFVSRPTSPMFDDDSPPHTPQRPVSQLSARTMHRVHLSCENELEATRKLNERLDSEKQAMLVDLNGTIGEREALRLEVRQLNRQHETELATLRLQLKEANDKLDLVRKAVS